MSLSRFLIVFALTAISTSAFAEEWEEVFSEKNSANDRFYFDRIITKVGSDSIQTQYMIVKSKTQPVFSNRAESPQHDKVIFRAVINCKNYSWKFMHRAYYLNNSVEFEENTSGGVASTPPPKGSAPFNISEKLCASNQ